MRHSRLVVKFSFALVLVVAFSGASPAEARDFTLGLKAWYASGSATGAEVDEDLFFPGFYFAWGATDRIWISAAYVDGEVDFAFPNDQPGTSRSFKEEDADLVIGWSFPKLDVGVGYRDAEFTARSDAGDFPTSSAGPMVFLGGGDLWGQSNWGYYWALAYMFEDMDDDDGSQEHFNGEAGFRWTSQKNFSVLFGYRYKEYSGDFTADLTFDGPVVNLAYTWR